MELHKLPAGRLATVFYKDEPQSHSIENSTEMPAPSDVEKGTPDSVLQQVFSGRSKRRSNSLQNQLDRKGQAFAWKDVSLDIKTKEGTKRLLHSMDGEHTPCSGALDH